MKTAAEKLLDAARAATPERPEGVARSGSVVVTYRRAFRLTGGMRMPGAGYGVGTDALLIAGGQRSDVLPYVEALLAGCVTRVEAMNWIAAAPERARLAAAKGARLPAGTVRAA